MTTQEKLDKIIRHISHVKDDCIVLGENLIKRGEDDLGRKLIANGFIHDASKFGGIEFLYLNDETKEKEPEKFQLALEQHQSNNQHHPEYWLSIDLMPRLYLAEFVCDVKARSNEFGTDLRSWICESATKRWKFAKTGRVYKEIKEFVDLLIEKPFS